jgi:hypothetical protein
MSASVGSRGRIAPATADGDSPAARTCFSFLCLAYRAEAYLAETIESVRAQTRGDRDLVVVELLTSGAVPSIRPRTLALVTLSPRSPTHEMKWTRSGAGGARRADWRGRMSIAPSNDPATWPPAADLARVNWEIEGVWGH